MTKITLNTEQAAIIAAATEPVRICNPDGSIAGWVARKPKDVTPQEPLFTPEEIAEAERRIDAPGRWYTTKEVLDHLRALE